MKKLTLITILILGLTASPAYADNVQAKEASEDASLDMEEADATFTAATLPMSAGPPAPAIAGPQAGISGSVMPFLQESFQTDLATGAATLSIPITVPPGRKNIEPNLGLSYSSNNSNGICGVGWGIPTNCIQRSTKKGVPAYDDSKDTFIFAAAGSNAELVNIGDNQYRAKIESAFMKYVFNTNADNTTSWTVYDKSGTRYIFGHRLEDSSRTFAWYLTKVVDIHNNYITYIYDQPEDGQVYLKEIRYTGFEGAEPLDTDKSIVFNYEERLDKLTNYRTGWKIVTGKRLKSIYVNLNEGLVWKYVLEYGEPSGDTGRSLLRSITVYDKDGNSLPAKTFKYQELEETKEQ